LLTKGKVKGNVLAIVLMILQCIMRPSIVHTREQLSAACTPPISHTMHSPL